MSESKISPLPRVAHSLLGVVPLGVFVAVHLVTVASRPAPTTAAAEPGVLAYGLGVALVVHAVYGLWLLGNRRDNVGRVPTARNWLYSLSRWSAPVILLFVGYHVVGVHVMGVRDHVAQSVSDVPGVWLYAIGLTAVILHLARGLWSASINLGLAASPRARRIVALIAAVLAIVLWGLGAVGIWRALRA